jgi:serine/threonine protein kinase
MKRRKRDAPLVPERIGRYDVLLPIASGGMGTVYLARSRGLGGFERYVALKVMHAHLQHEEEFASDLIEEAKLAGRIQHPNVVQVMDVGDDPHGIFLVMEYVEGDSLAGLLRMSRKEDPSKRVEAPPTVGLRILHDALLGLHVAHELTDGAGAPQHLVHRDFSPQNIMVGTDGISRLTDFGVAKATTRITHTATGFIKGKVHYMSPEQAKTESLDRRCDVWAAGVIAWELLARKRLYRERTDTGILLQLVTEPPPRLRTVRPAIPKVLDDAVAFALSTALASRCPTAKQLADELAMGAEELGGLADVSELAAFVKEKAGTLLARRREQIEEVVKLRAEISTIAQSATVDSELSATPGSGGRGSGSGSSGSGLGASPADDPTVDMGGQQDRDEATIDPDTIRDTETIRLQDEPDRIAEELREVANATAQQEEPSVTEVSQSLSLQPPGSADPRGNRRPSPWLVTAVIGVIGIGTVGLLTSSDETPSAGERSDVGATSSGSASSVPASSVPASATVATTPALSGLPSSEPSAVELSVSANAAVVELRIGARKIKIEPKRKTFEVELGAEESAADVELVAISADGRKALVTLAAHSSEIALEFPAARVRPQPPRTKRPTRLAPSPYEK